VQALVGIATYDAGIACTDAKYHYWLLRPTQADSTIVLADRLILPNFPSYPAGHACLSGAIAETIAALIPEAREEVTKLAEEAAVSRLYAGVHYPFDNETGLELGRQVARYVIAEDAGGRLMARWQ
jgi:membrane-associated phospholipid phosphatase